MRHKALFRPHRSLYSKVCAPAVYAVHVIYLSHVFICKVHLSHIFIYAVHVPYMFIHENICTRAARTQEQTANSDLNPQT
jgi:hypothetical protein